MAHCIALGLCPNDLSSHGVIGYNDAQQQAKSTASRTNVTRWPATGHWSAVSYGEKENESMPRVSGLGHVGIYVNDLMKQRDFYTRVMGLEIADEDLEGRGMVFLSAHPEEEHHELVLMKGRSAPADTQLINQVSFKVDSINELKAFYRVFNQEGVRIQRTVSHGNAFGMYALDPEGNTIEVYYKTGFPVPQPHGDPIDLEASDEDLLALARAAIPQS
jgi:catechol-2,3-dioxygenase